MVLDALIEISEGRSAKDVLAEGLSKIVYHGTSIENALKILDSDKFQLTAAAHSASDTRVNAGKTFYLSVSRIKYGGFMRGERPFVNMILDGEKLGANNKGKPVDYYGNVWRKAALGAGEINQFLRNDENEERVLSDRMEIPNAKKIIKELHVLILLDGHRTKSDYSGPYRALMRRLSISARRAEIPIYFYTEEKTYRLMNKGKSVQYTDVFGDDRGEGGSEMKRYGKSESGYKYNQKTIVNVLKLYKATLLAKRFEDIPAELQAGANNARGFDVYARIESEIHNNKRSNDPEDRKNARLVSEIIKMSKEPSLKKAIDKIMTRNYELEKEKDKRESLSPKMPTGKWWTLEVMKNLVKIERADWDDDKSYPYPKDHVDALMKTTFLQAMEKDAEDYKDSNAYYNLVSRVMYDAKNPVFYGTERPSDLTGLKELREKLKEISRKKQQRESGK